MRDVTSVLDSASAFVQPWADLYANNTLLATGVLALHLVSMFIAGGMAIAADRAILRSKPGTADAVRAVVADLGTTHSVVVGWLISTIVSGLLLLTSDLGTFAVSRVYWIKMSAFVLLLLNGLRMQRAERAVMGSLEGVPIRTTEMPVPFPKQQWSGIRGAAAVSLALWLSIVLLGVVLTNG